MLREIGSQQSTTDKLQGGRSVWRSVNCSHSRGYFKISNCLSLIAFEKHFFIVSQNGDTRRDLDIEPSDSTRVNSSPSFISHRRDANANDLFTHCSAISNPFDRHRTP